MKTKLLPWLGNYQPVPDDTIVETIYLNGHSRIGRADCTNWAKTYRHTYKFNKIIKWRILSKTESLAREFMKL